MDKTTKSTYSRHSRRQKNKLPISDSRSNRQSDVSTPPSCSSGRAARPLRMNQQRSSDSEDSSEGRYTKPFSQTCAEHENAIESHHYRPELDRGEMRGRYRTSRSSTSSHNQNSNLSRNQSSQESFTKSYAGAMCAPPREPQNAPVDYSGELPSGVNARSYFSSRYSNPFLQELSVTPPPGFQRLAFRNAPQTPDRTQKSAVTCAELLNQTPEEQEECALFHNQFTSGYMEGMVSVTNPEAYKKLPKTNVLAPSMSDIDSRVLPEPEYNPSKVLPEPQYNSSGYTQSSGYMSGLYNTSQYQSTSFGSNQQDSNRQPSYSDALTLECRHPEMYNQNKLYGMCQPPSTGDGSFYSAFPITSTAQQFARLGLDVEQGSSEELRGRNFIHCLLTNETVEQEEVTPPSMDLLRTQRQAGDASTDDEMRREFSAASISHCSTPKQKQSHCTFCKTNREMPIFVRSHMLKDDAGKISCPVLRKFVCTVCGVSGDFAHTFNYCPFNKAADAQPSLRHSANGRRVRGRREN